LMRFLQFVNDRVIPVNIWHLRV